MTYAEKLLNPRWQQKRLRVFDRDNFTCKLRGNRDQTLHIHHHLYEKGKDPWDYSDDVLDTYCRKCHAVVEYIKKNLPSLILAKVFYKDMGADSDLVFSILFENKKVLLAVFRYYSDKEIELVVHIPSSVIKIVYSLFNVQENG